MAADTLSSRKVLKIAKNEQEQPTKVAGTLGRQNVLKIAKNEQEQPTKVAGTLGSQKVLEIAKNPQQQPIKVDALGSQKVLEIAKNEQEQPIMAKTLSYQLSVIDDNGEYERGFEPMASSLMDNKENLLSRMIRLGDIFQRLHFEALQRCCLCGTAVYKKDRLQHLYMCCLQIRCGLYTLRCDICNVFRCVYKSHLNSHRKSCTAVKFLPLRVTLKTLLKSGKEEAFVTGMISSIETKGSKETVDIVNEKFDRKMKIANKDNRSEKKKYTLLLK